MLHHPERPALRRRTNGRRISSAWLLFACALGASVSSPTTGDPTAWTENPAPCWGAVGIRAALGISDHRTRLGGIRQRAPAAGTVQDPVEGEEPNHGRWRGVAGGESWGGAMPAGQGRSGIPPCGVILRNPQERALVLRGGGDEEDEGGFWAGMDEDDLRTVSPTFLRMARSGSADVEPPLRCRAISARADARAGMAPCRWALTLAFQPPGERRPSLSRSPSSEGRGERRRRRRHQGGPMRY